MMNKNLLCLQHQNTLRPLGNGRVFGLLRLTKQVEWSKNSEIRDFSATGASALWLFYFWARCVAPENDETEDCYDTKLAPLIVKPPGSSVGVGRLAGWDWAPCCCRAVSRWLREWTN